MVGLFTREKISESRQLVKESFYIIKKNKNLLLFPLFSIIVTFSLFISFLIYFLNTFKTEKITYSYPLYLILFLYYLASYFIMTFFNTGLITCAYISLNGGKPTFLGGLKNALKYLNKIFMWSFLSSTVGLVLTLIEGVQLDSGDSDSPAEIITVVALKILGLTIQIAWTVLTFFIVPVLIFEDLGIIESIKKSGKIIKETWGENIVGRISMWLYVFGIGSLVGVLVAFIFLFILFRTHIGSEGVFRIGASTVAIVLLAVFIFYGMVLGILHSTLNSIFTTALYIYVTTGELPDIYTPELLKNAFRTKILNKKKW